MKCDKVIERFLNQNDSRYPSFFVRLHMLFCPGCRDEMRMLRDVILKSRSVSSYAMPRDLSNLIMGRIYKSDLVYEKNVSSTKWLFSGAVIFASIFLVSYSESFKWLKNHFGSGLEIPLYIILGMGITIYSASYIGTHIDVFKKLVEFVSNKIQ